jgi:hypothetical protein
VQFEQNTRFGLALIGALVVHALALVGLALSISFPLPEPETIEPRIVAIALPVPPPPSGEALGTTEALTIAPRFRPREPLGLAPERRQRYGDPALAVWKYLCNRDNALSEAARRDCPAPGFGNVDLGLRDPLNRRGDAGVMLGNDTATMSLDEAGAAKGWIKRPPPRGQSGLAGTTDQVNQPAGPSIFEDLPSLKPPTEGVPNLE